MGRIVLPMLTIALQLVASGCSRGTSMEQINAKAAHSGRYGEFAAEAKYCLDLMARCTQDHTSKLSQKEVDRMVELQSRPGPVAFEATGVLGTYGLRQPEVKSLLKSRVPLLLKGPEPWQIACAAAAAKWYSMSEHHAAFSKISGELDSKPQLTAAEFELQLKVASYLEAMDK
jgi:hypothetical protein